MEYRGHETTDLVTKIRMERRKVFTLYIYIYIYYIIIYIISLSKCSNLAREFSVVGSKQGYGYFADQEKTFIITLH